MILGLNSLSIAIFFIDMGHRFSMPVLFSERYLCQSTLRLLRTNYPDIFPVEACQIHRCPEIPHAQFSEIAIVILMPKLLSDHVQTQQAGPVKVSLTRLRKTENARDSSGNGASFTGSVGMVESVRSVRRLSGYYRHCLWDFAMDRTAQSSILRSQTSTAQ